MAVVFVLVATIPLCLIPFFPEFWLMRLLSSSQAAVFGLGIVALIMSLAVDRLLYGKVEMTNVPYDR